MMAPPSPHQSTDRKRVKVYELRNNDWFDRGTGFCIANYSPDKESKVVVESEDQPERILLETRITRDDSFQKQQETLIVWTEPTNGLDMALSFQEADGCNLIWRFISTVQQGFGPGAGPDDSLSDDLAMEMAAPIALPPAELANLHELEHNMRIMSATGSGRDALAKAIMHEDYIRKLIPLVEMAEDLESLGDLHTLCNIMKIILLLNDTGIIEHAVSDDCVLGVVGALEYDPDFPRHKANHRQWLSNQGRYKEVVRIQDDQIRRKIHQTYRLQYLKDVVLARILDDPTFSVLNSLIFFNQVDIVQHLQTNSAFLKDLFGIFSDPNEDVLRKKEAVLFIQQCCAIAKNLQPPARNNLYTNFLNHGLLQVIDFGLRNLDVSARVGATDIFVSMIDHDPQMIRHTIYRQIHEKDSPLTDTLIDLLLVEVDLGIKSQVSDALKVLLDPNPPGPPPEQFMTKGPNGELQPRPRPPPPPVDPQQEIFLTYFYDHSALRLFRPLLDLETRSELKFSALNDGIFGYLNEILCFYVRQHQHRIKFFVLQHNLAQRFTQLLGCREKHLQLVAIRFFRQLVTLQDEFYIRHLIEKRIFGPVLDVLIDTLPRDNLLCSACLDLFALIAKEQKPRELVQHLIENYRDKIELLSYLEPFSLLLKAGTQPPPGPHSAIDAYYIEHEDELPGRRPTNTGARGLMEHIAVDPDEEAYYNVSDDEEEHLQLKAGAPPASVNGAPLGKPLVDYPSDEELDDIADAIALAPREVERNDEDSAIVDDDAMSNHSSMSSGAPPERLSEKRRREEDEEDELGKLVHHKRRNSSSASMNAAANAAALRRKKSLTGQGAAPRKIAISISSTIKTPAAQTPAKEEEAV